MRKRCARQDPEYRELENARRRRGYSPSERFPGATAKFLREFVGNPFGATCVVCDRLWYAGDLTTSIGGVRECAAEALRQCLQSEFVEHVRVCGTYVSRRFSERFSASVCHHQRIHKLCSVFSCPCRHETFLSWAEEQMARYPSGRWTREDGSVCEYEPSRDEVEMSEELEYLLLTFPREPEGWLDELYNVVSS
ncbi:hypothetical protein HPB49_020613 [Dermacentor silvarum]|uniref:Uncharacterized protein n=1 Tax=Dermacentor silvarum TaxID=543639 RepID=A0ACB8CMM1_DERSI|nr:hypothetical protein HPB49_020613 [Dermacentor silvarum]